MTEKTTCKRLSAVEIDILQGGVYVGSLRIDSSQRRRPMWHVHVVGLAPGMKVQTTSEQGVVIVDDREKT